MEDISIEQDLFNKVDLEAVRRGHYDSLILSCHAIPRDYKDFVFDYLPEQLRLNQSRPTVGTIRNLKMDDAHEFFSFNNNRARILENLQQCLPITIGQLLSECALNEELAHYEASCLNFPIDQSVIPRWLIPIGAGKQKTILHYLDKLNFSSTALGIREISLHEFAQSKGIRPERVDELIRLKRQLPKIVETREALQHIEDHGCEDRVIQPVAIDDWEMITVNRILKHHGEPRLRISHIFDAALNDNDTYLNPHDLWRLSQIRQKLALAIMRGDSSLFLADDSGISTCSELDELVARHLHDFLSLKNFKSQDSLCKTILLARRGIGGSKFALRELGNLPNFASAKVTRERVRQLQEKAEQYFIWSLGISPEGIEKILRYRAIDTIHTEMPILYNLLGESALLLKRFLGMLAENQSIILDVDVHVLDDFFASTPQPITTSAVLDFLSGDEEQEDALEGDTLDGEPHEDLAASMETFRVLSKRGVIEVINDRVYPRKLHPIKAMGHLMAAEPKGMVTDDIVAILPDLRYSEDTRADNYLKQLYRNPYLFFAGSFSSKSICKHQNFLPEITPAQLEEFAQRLNSHLEQLPEQRARLRDVYECDPLREKLDYHAFRHFVKELGQQEEVAFVFDGKSRADNIFFTKERSSTLTNKDRVLTLVSDAPHGITLREITRRFHCQNDALVHIQLRELRTDDKVWKISRRLYSTPGNFIKSLDKEQKKALTTFPKHLSDLLDREEARGRILDISLVAKGMEGMDPEVCLALAMQQSPEMGLEINRSLISRSTIPFNSLRDAFAQLHTPGDTRETAFARVAKLVAATPTALENSWTSFRQNYKPTTLAR